MEKLIVRAYILALCGTLIGCGHDSIGPPPAPPLVLPLVNRIAFESTDTDPNGDIVIIKTDGSDRRSLTGPATRDVCPSLSPDGNWIAFLQQPAAATYSPYDMVLAKADGTDVRVLGTTRSPYYDCPIWSRDSRLVAFRSPQDPGVRRHNEPIISTFDLSGTRVGQFTAAEANGLNFSSDDQRLLYATWTIALGPPIDFRLESNLVDGTGWKHVVGALSGDWSPIGPDIVFSTCGVYCANPAPADSCIAICITSDTGATWRTLVNYGRAPIFSPDGSMVAFSCDPDLCVIPSQGGTVTRFSSAELDGSIEWSADGGTIVFICGQVWDVCVADVQTQTVRNLTQTPTTTERNPSLSPGSSP